MWQILFVDGIALGTEMVEPRLHLHGIPHHHGIGQEIETHRLIRLVHQQVRVFALKESLRLIGGHDLQSRVMVTLFGLFAEIERELLSLRTKEALAAARRAGKRLGRPPGVRGRSKLDGKAGEIHTLLKLHVSKASIAKITGVDRSTLYHFMRSRGLMPQ